jgi:hypothetical protein
MHCVTVRCGYGLVDCIYVLEIELESMNFTAALRLLMAML